MPLPAAWNTLQFGHCASQGRQSAGALPLDKGLESLTDQRRFLRDPSKLLGDTYEIVIQRNGCSHGKLQAPIIASNDVIICALRVEGPAGKSADETAKTALAQNLVKPPAALNFL